MNVKELRQLIKEEISKVLKEENPSIFSTIKVGKLEIVKDDFPTKLDWDDASDECAELGNGWRLPTMDELRFMYTKRSTIPGLKDDIYWSNESLNQDFAKSFNMFRGGPYQNGVDKIRLSQVRAVRDIPTNIELGNLEIAKDDFPTKMNIDDAAAACAELGSGWRLPTNKELRFMYDHRDLIPGIKDDSYWSGKEKNNVFGWIFSFIEGQPYGDDRKSKHYVRAVRSI